MKNVFEFDNYREFIKYYVSHETAPRGLRTELAKAMGCQAAYLTQVLAGNVELTEDHAFRLTKHLRFTTLEQDFFLLLLRASRASSHELKEHLQAQAKSLVKRNQDVQNKVSAQNIDEREQFSRYYYSSWIPSTVHIATSSESFRTPENISKRLGLPEQQVLECLMSLRDQGLVERNHRDQWTFTGTSLHLPKTSPLMTNHQIHHRLQAIKALQSPHAENLHFSSIFTLDPQSMNDVRKMLLDCVEKSHKMIHEGGTEEIYGMCLDLFEVR